MRILHLIRMELYTNYIERHGLSPADAARRAMRFPRHSRTPEIPRGSRLMDSPARATMHHCHARFCGAHCRPEWLMCYRHWKMVPRALQQAVWVAYRPGQCDDMNPSLEWFEAADAAIEAVFEKERAAGAFAQRRLRL